MTDSTYKNITVIPSGEALAAEIRDVDLRRPLSEAVANEIRQALLDFQVIFFRNQSVTEQQQVDFTRHFGVPIAHVRDQPDRQVKEIFIISNVKENGEPIGALGNDEISFHSDLSYMRKPGTICTLYAVEVPSVGGETEWVNCYAIYDALDPSMQTRIKGQRALHRHYIESQNPKELIDQPMVRRHPQTDRKSLFVSPHFTKNIVGMSHEESNEILSQLFELVHQPRFKYRHHWQVGDLLVWDNRSTMHRREPFSATERRVMKRTQIFNDEIPYE